MATTCKKCFMLKLTPDSKCACNVKKFDESKLVKKKEPKQAKPIKQVSEKKKERIKTNWSELNFFKTLFKKKVKAKENFCVICKKQLTEEDVTPASFAHILPKSKYPIYRYFDNNINLVCNIEHHKKADDAVNEFKKDKGLIELENLIKNLKTPDLTNYIDY